MIEVWNVASEQALRLRVHLSGLDGLVHLVAAVRRLFDLDADPKPIDRHLARDPRLAPLVGRARASGFRARSTRSSSACGRSSVSRCRSPARPRSVASLVDAFGEPVPGIGALGLTHLFPSAATIAEADLGALGVPGARIRALQGFAEAIATGSIALDRAAGLDDAVAALCALPGIGPWTAHYIAMRACAERDAFPASDLAIRRELGADPEAAAEAWRPWRAYGAMHIWAALGLTSGPIAATMGREAQRTRSARLSVLEAFAQVSALIPA